MIRTKRGIACIVSGLFLVMGLLSQSNSRIHEQYRFKFLTVDEGLNNNRVRGLVQDKYGFIWIGTRTGIDMFDGYKIKSYEYYYNDTIRESFIETRGSLCDNDGTIWFVGSYGIVYYNRQKDRYERLIDPAYPDRISLTLGIDEDQDSILWFTNNDELLNYNPKMGEFNYFVTNPDDPFSLPEGNPERLLVDRKNNLWIGYLDEGGVACYDREAKRFIHYTSTADTNSLAENYVERIYMDPEGTVWFGHNNEGISKFSYQTKTFTRYMPDPSIRQSGRVRGLLKDPQGNFWIGTQAGLYLFDEVNETFYRYAYNKHPISALSHNSIQLIKIDNQEGLWLGTFAGGVSYTNLNTSGFVRYDYSPIESEFYLNDKIVYSIAIDKTGNIWIGTENGGLNYLDRKSGKFTYYLHDPDNSNSPLSSNIKEIIVNEENNIWFCTYKGGFSYFNTHTKQFTNFLASENNPDGFPEPIIYCMLFDPVSPEILWLGTWEGLYKFNTTTLDYTFITNDLLDYKNIPDIPGQVFTLQSFNNEKIFIGTDKLVILDRVQNTFKSYTTVNGIDIQSVNFIHVDKKGFVWFDINNKFLVRMDESISKFIVFGMKDGIPNVRLLEAHDDKKGNLWISTNKGLLQLMNMVNNQDTLIIRTYDRSDNLQSMEFQYHAKAVSEDGEIFFGGINGFNSFYPENIVTNPYPPNVHITNLKVANNIVTIGEKIHGRVLITKPMIETDYIKIHHKIKVFSIEFAGLHFVAPENNQFEFMLEGYDDHWTHTDASVRFATYSNLPAGTYYFKVNAANNNGKWADEPAVLKIKVIPPFWKTWWFYMLIGVFITIAVIVFIRLREAQLKRDKETLEKKLKEGEQELSKRKTEIENQKNALEEKERQEKVQKWFNRGLANFSDILSSEKNNIDQLSQQLITNIVQYVEADQGGLFLLNNNDENNIFLELVAHYAYNTEKLEKKVFYPGEGQVGVCFKSKEIVYIDNLPDTYAKISSGLGESTLSHLILLPLVMDEYIIGVLELASIYKLEKYKIDFLQKLSENIVSVISTVKSNEIIKEMLSKSQVQSEQLQAQEEELRQNMEEMKATQDEADRREQKLHDETRRLKMRVEELAKENIEKDKVINKMKKEARK